MKRDRTKDRKRRPTLESLEIRETPAALGVASAGVGAMASALPAALNGTSAASIGTGGAVVGPYSTAFMRAGPLGASTGSTIITNPFSGTGGQGLGVITSPFSGTGAIGNGVNTYPFSTGYLRTGPLAGNVGNVVGNLGNVVGGTIGNLGNVVGGAIGTTGNVVGGTTGGVVGGLITNPYFGSYLRSGPLGGTASSIGATSGATVPATIGPYTNQIITTTGPIQTNPSQPGNTTGTNLAEFPNGPFYPLTPFLDGGMNASSINTGLGVGSSTYTSNLMRAGSFTNVVSGTAGGAVGPLGGMVGTPIDVGAGVNTLNPSSGAGLGMTTF